MEEKIQTSLSGRMPEWVEDGKKDRNLFERLLHMEPKTKYQGFIIISGGTHIYYETSQKTLYESEIQLRKVEGRNVEDGLWFPRPMRYFHLRSCVWRGLESLPRTEI